MFDSRTSESRKAQVTQQKEIDEVKAQLEKELQAVQLAGAGSVSSVSYTHLTLPTKPKV